MFINFSLLFMFINFSVFDVKIPLTACFDGPHGDSGPDWLIWQLVYSPVRSGVRTILNPEIFYLVKFARSDSSQLVDLQGRSFLSYLFCRVGQFSVGWFAGPVIFHLLVLQSRTILSWLICRAGHFSVTCLARSDNSQTDIMWHTTEDSVARLTLFAFLRKIGCLLLLFIISENIFQYNENIIKQRVLYHQQLVVASV